MNEAIKALKAGDQKTAYRLLRRHLRINPKDVKAWLWISQATADKKKQIDALKQALRLQPDHPKSKAIRRRIRKLENSETKQRAAQSKSSSSVKNSDEYPFDELLAEVRAELQMHMEKKEAAQNEALLNKAKASLLQEKLEARAQHDNLNDGSYTTDREPNSDFTLSSTENMQEQQQRNATSTEDNSNEGSIDLILELKKDIEEKEKSRSKKKATPIKSAMKVAAPAVSKRTSPPASVLHRAEKTAVNMKSTSSSRKSLVLWMWGVLLLSVLVVVGVVFIIPNLPLSN